jgi:hypothetical protein
VAVLIRARTHFRADCRSAFGEAPGIAIHDHLVIGRKGHASFRSLGTQQRPASIE